VKIWDKVITDGIRTFDIDMKKAQLKRLLIPCSILLVDECQDLDECQVDWLHSQSKHGTHIYFVGDAAQAIYSFRGAKSSHVMKIQECIDLKLTRSWRFGPEISKIANIALFAKENSPQTSLSGYLWKPYRVQGARDEDYSTVTTESLISSWRKHTPLTLIGYSNNGLMIKAMDMLGLGALKNPGRERHSDEEGGLSDDDDMTDVESKELFMNLDKFPKFHINGEGEMSGMGRWRTATHQIRSLYELWSSRDVVALPAKHFPDFADEKLTWNGFAETCQIKEITKYEMAAAIVNTYKQNTPEALEAFEEHIMKKKYSAEEADIILTTCHSAKGLEWDHVEICGDLLNLANIPLKDTIPMHVRHPSFLTAPPGCFHSKLCESRGNKRKGWQFMLSNFKDTDINILYVAITRAKKTLSLPEGIKSLLQQMDIQEFLIDTFTQEKCRGKSPCENDECLLTVKSDGKDKKLTKGEAWNLYHDICAPLRKELGIPSGKLILETLFPERIEEEAGIDSREDVKIKAEPIKSEVKDELNASKPSAVKYAINVKSDVEQERDEDDSSVSTSFHVKDFIV